MKKSLFLLFPLAIAALTSCIAGPGTTDPSVLLFEVACPAGAPAVAFYEQLRSDKLEVNADPANVVAYMTESSSKDIVVAPTNAGLNAILKKKAPFKIAATLTFGNFYLAATGNDENRTLDPEDYVVAFQQGNVPDKLFSYVYGDTLTNVHYVTAASDAAKVLISGKNESDNNATAAYVLMAEPALTNALTKNQNAFQYASIQEEFEKKSGGKKITQASLFVRNGADASNVSRLLNIIERNVNAFVKNPDVMNEFLKDVDPKVVQEKFLAPAATLVDVTKRGNRMGLGYQKASENKGAIETFMSLFGVNEVDEEVYYQ